MLLKEYILQQEAGTEIAVIDEELDLNECYFYTPETSIVNLDQWDTDVLHLASLMELKSVENNKCCVNFLELIEPAIDALNKADLFNSKDAINIAFKMPMVIAGYVSEEWLHEFVTLLCKVHGE